MGAGELIVMFVGFLIVFLIAVAITRAIFSIPKFLRMKKAELKILGEMAVKAGVSQDLISGIINEAEM
ncbi:hypothetical protein ACVW0P_004505 [Mucilaginibacter sp. UYNi724]